MRIPVVSKDGSPLMPTKPAKARKLLAGGVAEKRWTKEGIFYLQMLTEVGEKTQEIALAIDPGSKYDGYVVAGPKEVVLQGMAVLPRKVQKRMETRSQQRRTRRRRKLRRRPTRFDNRKRQEGWIAPSQLAKVQLRIRIMQRLCQILPITDIVVEDVRFNHAKHQWGTHFSTVEIGKAKVYAEAEKLATFWKCRGWETSDARREYRIEKTGEKSELIPTSHAHDAWAMVCWLYGEKPRNETSEFYVWRRQETAQRQLHLMQPAKGGKRRRYGGTTHPHSDLRKGDVIRYERSTQAGNGETVGYVGGWTNDGKVVSLVGPDGKRIRQAGAGKIELLARSPNILTERRKAASSPD